MKTVKGLWASEVEQMTIHDLLIKKESFEKITLIS